MGIGRRTCRYLCGQSQVGQVPFQPSITHSVLFEMESGWEIETENLEFQKLEDVFKDRDGGIFDTIISFGPIHQLKTKLDAFKDQGTYLHNVF